MRGLRSPSQRRCAGRCPARPRRIGQRGLTLIETIVALAVLSIGVVGIAAGFVSIVHDSGISQQQASLEGDAASVVSHIQTTDPYMTCATATSYSAGSLRPGVMLQSITVAESTVSRLTRSPAPPDDYSGTAPLQGCGGGSYDYGSQEITIKVCSTLTCVSETFWKGDR